MVRLMLLLFILLPYGAATIDGLPDEWNEGNFLGRLHVPEPEGTELASLHGMTDCTTMSFGVMADVPGSVRVDAEESWIRVGALTYTDVTYINAAGDWADGFEIQTPITAVEFTATAHANIYDGGEVQTARIDDLVLRLDCATAATLAWFECGTDGEIVGCAWETLNEMSMSYFYVWRGDALFAIVVPRFLGQPMGWMYAVDDVNPGEGLVTYTLEVVNHVGPSDYYTDTLRVGPWRAFLPHLAKGE